MFKELLLDKTEKKEFLILKSLYINSGKMKKQEICKLNNISIPTLSTYIDNINHKFRDLINKNYMNIHKTKDHIFLSFKNGISLDNLMSYYIEDSIIFKIFIFLLKNNNPSNISICKELNISISTFNRKLLLCNNILKNFNLVIKNNKIQGSELQICYFYYSLLWNSSINRKNINFMTYTNFIKFIEKTLNIQLTILEKTKINIWMRLLICRKLNFRKNKLVIFDSNIKKVEKNKIFILINTYFDTIFSNNDYNIKYMSYITFCFFLSSYILPKKSFTLKNISKDFLPYQINMLVLSEFNNIYDINSIDSYAITNFIFRITIFSGYFYSVDKLTLKYYLNKSQSKFRNAFSKYLFKKINSQFNNFNIDFFYFNLAITLILKYINNSPNYLLHNKSTITIGILLRNDPLLIYGLINQLNGQLREKFDITIELYSETKSYDLVLTNVYNHYLSNNYTYICNLTDLGMDYDLKTILNILNKIEIDRYIKF